MYSYPGLVPRLPAEIRVALHAAASQLDERLRAVDLRALPISEYNRTYLTKHHLPSLQSTLQKYVHILGSALVKSPVGMRDSVVVDYGGGAGLMSMLARLAGVGGVVYNDIYDVSCADARVLASAVGAVADRYVPGDLADLRRDLEAARVTPNVVVSYDVIEHIYDIEQFFRELPAIAPHGLSIFMGSGANARNPAIRRSIMARQRVVELTGREVHPGHKQRDCAIAYRTVRAAMIREAEPSLAAEQVDRLAALTRGYMARDVGDAARIFARTGREPRALEHPTNTCDPFTGNWEEHLMDPYGLASLLRSGGMKAQVVAGYWGTPRSRAKAPVAMALNTAIRLGGVRLGLRLAPYYAICAWST